MGYYHDNRERLIEAQKRRAARRRRQMVAAYGGKCAGPGCSETDPDVLQLDHIFDDARFEMERLGVANTKAVRLSGSNLIDVLYRMGWPKDRYQLLCANCNIKKEKRRRAEEGIRTIDPNLPRQPPAQFELFVTSAFPQPEFNT